MAAFIKNICYFKNKIKIRKFWGYDMWYQSMVQILGLDAAQLVSIEQ